MAHKMEAFVGKSQHVLARLDGGAAWRLKDLPHGFVLIPRCELLRQSGWTAETPAVADFELFDHLDVDEVAWAVALSTGGLLAYIETDYFGGWGTQAALVWQDGRVLLGPLTHSDDNPAQKRTPLASLPINTALRALGVVRAADKHDEFDTLGLGEFRDLSLETYWTELGM